LLDWRNQALWRGGRLVGLAVLGASLCGCASFWEQMSRRDISVTQRFNEYWSTPDPLVVLRDSKDGDLRAQALRSLKEPRRNGGNAQDQEAILRILTAAATTEPQPLCRAAAVHALGNFTDPRAVPALIDAYYKATTFAPETATVVQCEALAALGKTKDPAAVELLTRVVRAPSPAFDVPEADKQQEQDRRTAAARALGNFSHYQATEALLYVLKNERDAGLRCRASEALAQATGKNLGDDPAAWDRVLNEHAYDGPVKPPHAKDSKLNLVGWFTRTE